MVSFRTGEDQVAHSRMIVTILLGDLRLLFSHRRACMVGTVILYATMLYS